MAGACGMCGRRLYNTLLACRARVPVQLAICAGVGNVLLRCVDLPRGQPQDIGWDIARPVAHIFYSQFSW